MPEYWLLRRKPENTVDTVTWGLPQTWRNVDGLPGLSDAELLALGWERLADAELSPADEAIVFPLVVASTNARLKQYRYEREIGGMSIDGIAILTDRESQGLIDSLHGVLRDEIISSVKFSSAGGVTIDCNFALATVLRTAVTLYVQGCRNNEADHADAMALIGTAQARAAYDFTTGWPSNVVTTS